MLAYYLHNLSPFIFELRPGIGPRWYGFAYVVAFLLGFWLYRWLARRRYTEMPPEQVADFITWAAVFGVMLGGRIGWILFYGWKQDHSDDPWWWPLEVWKGGMASHGGILGLVLFTLYWARRHRLSWTSIGDNLCVVAPVGLCVVRLANFINGELVGKPSSLPWAMQFPLELTETAKGRFDLTPKAEAALQMPLHEILQRVEKGSQQDSQVIRYLADNLTPRHPSQLYEALLEGVFLFTALWLMRTRMRLPRGVITGAFFILYAALRIVGEFFREPDPAWHLGPLSAGQTLSLFMFAIGAGFIAWGLRAQQFEPAHRH